MDGLIKNGLLRLSASNDLIKYRHCEVSTRSVRPEAIHSDYFTYY